MLEIKEFMKNVEKDLIDFCQNLVRIKSFTGREEEVSRYMEKKMIELGYDEVIVDGLGSVIGRMGTGDKKLLFDSHIDTVAVDDEKDWSVDPFGGVIKDGKLFGRGSVDMKSAGAASVYAGYIAKELGLLEGKTIYVSTSVMEEDYDGEALLYEFENLGIKPDYAVICEATQCRLAIGQRGRALMKIDMEGVSAHGSAPEKGVNAVYKMVEIINRIEDLEKKYINMAGKIGEKPSIALTKIECETASYNAIPSKSTVYVDRRLIKGETYEIVENEMNEIVEGTGATWEIFKVIGKSWTGEEVVLNSFMPFWDISLEHGLTKAAFKAYEDGNERKPELMMWDFSTNGVATDKLNIPTIGFGPGDSKMAHVKDEHCPIDDIVKACEFYTNLIKNI
ncbi:YgeY family selenium metabolism-linked hydrolase [Anaeromicrobium sediminis]|nr:YgeY family selenium metabolism-linked hydrolase [Anaeromicrobium sediminis]